MTADKKEEKSKLLYETMSRYESREWLSGKKYVAGVDEAGRGPLAGPVVAAACILDPLNPIHGINDSKKLSPKKREELFEKIQQMAICYCVREVDNNIIDDINILNATKMAMVECLDNLSIKPDKVLVDAVSLEDTGLDVFAITKGDTLSVSIAAASILAKVTRDRIMVEKDKEFPGYGFARNKGYGTKEHYEGIYVNGITVIHRKSFLKGHFQ